MKKLFAITTVLLLAVTLLGQTPLSFKYQAVLRDSRGNIKANTPTSININILQGSSSGNVVYSENHYVTTNMYGLINLEIGNGMATKSSFSAIDWGTSTYFIKIFVDGVEMGTDQLLSVPYALNAKTAEKVTGKITELDPVFLASPAMGISSNNLTNWNIAFGWGNHATAGYLKSYTETDPSFLASPAGGITATNITRWNTAVGWGDHALAGYLKSNSESDPIFKAWNKSSDISITASQVSDFEASVNNNAAVLANSAKNSYPTVDAMKLAGIQTGAQKNVNADWNATSGDAQILNKPTIPIGTNPGDMQYWNGTAWVMVPAGLPGQFLQFTTAKIPAWSGAAFISLTSTSATSITDSTATSGGNISNSGGEATERGVCWSTSQNPTITDYKTNEGPGSGTFTSSITGLSALTTYYVRAYATNSLGTQYGNQISFKTLVKPIRKQKISGHVQKGPFVNGTTILMAELDSTLQQTGRNFNTQISNNSGSFEIANVVLTSSFVEFSANGYYYDEVKGSLSVAPLNLYALSDITDLTSVNVNILTHLEKQRVDYLISQNNTFAEAKKTAQAEIMAIFGITLSGMSNSETLDISVNSEGNAILLAISIMLQGNRSVGDLTELLANINNDIRTDGKMDSQSIMTSLRNSTKELVLPSIRSNLESRYQALGISATIPDFEKYIWKFLEFTGLKPLATSQTATNITSSGVTLNGEVNANSLSTTAIFEYGTSTSYGSTVTATQSPVTGHSAVTIGADLAALLPNTTYHFRVKAENSLGITVGNDATFTTRDGVVVLSTTPISAILTNSAASGGNITNDGGAAATARGVCWSTAQNPTNADSKTTDGTGTGSFTSSITGLTPGAVYYVRAYGTNTVGTVYGNQLSFTALGLVPAAATIAATSITTITATLNGTANANHLSTVVTFEYGTTVDYGSTATATQSPVTGSETNNVTVEITGLAQGILYHFRIKTVNELGTTYGSDLTFTTLTLPTVTTTAISDTTQTTATSGGNVTNDGGASITARGICWSTSANPTTADSKTSNSTGTGTFTSSLTGLIGNTTYFVRAYATNSVGTNYGNEVSFKTSPVLPVVTTTAISETTQTTATSGGNVTYDGGAEITVRGVCWSTSASPTTTDSKTTDGTGTGIFSSNLTVLTGNTTYFVRAYATNSVGTNYGSEVSFKTSPVLPTITTTAVSAITASTASSGGNITSDGGASISARGVCWSTAQNPTTSDNKTTDGTGTGIFTSAITSLTPGAIYYTRAFATNIVGTVYGNQLTFTSLGQVPTAVTIAASGITTTTATLNGTVNANYLSTVVTFEYGTSIDYGSTATATQSPVTGSISNAVSSPINGLTAAVVYHFRIKTVNELGTTYGSDLTFTTFSVTDIDGNGYSTVTIGTQIWMAENLKTTKYNDGTVIPLVTDEGAWAELITPGISWYDNNIDNKNTYGALYNWFTVNTGKLCPTGWHVPSDAEWTTLTTYLGGQSVAGGKLMETGRSHWKSPNSGATNTSGFTALPGGTRYSQDGSFHYLGEHGFWWSFTEASASHAWFRSIYSNGSSIDPGNVPKHNGFSVRCLGD